MPVEGARLHLELPEDTEGVRDRRFVVVCAPQGSTSALEANLAHVDATWDGNRVAMPSGAQLASAWR